ncbi:MAG: hypothetical protein Q9165_000747 [Trypethelium subeluteriae]
MRRKEALKAANITHVLSVLRLDVDEGLFSPYHHKIVQVDDVDDENLLEHFPVTNKFIQDGLDGGGGVLVHCAMGKSRSAACVVAYMMHKSHMAPSEALTQLQTSRPLCEPNAGFMKQLELFHQMNSPQDLETDPIYQRWLYQREVQISRECGQAPDADKIRFEDEHRIPEKGSEEFSLRCRKCRYNPPRASVENDAHQIRRPLATSQFVTDHKRKGDELDESLQAQDYSAQDGSCAHYFIDPLSWMRTELEQGKLDGRLECPKCKTNVGKYAWQGMQCSCGEWIVPGITLAKGRVDRTRPRPVQEASLGIRMPPTVGSRVAGRSQENL